jgi:hypothetical protein
MGEIPESSPKAPKAFVKHDADCQHSAGSSNDDECIGQNDRQSVEATARAVKTSCSNTRAENSDIQGTLHMDAGPSGDAAEKLKFYENKVRLLHLTEEADPTTVGRAGTANVLADG